jgi:hypothetical protein
MIGNTVATFVVAKWEGAFDRIKFEACLAEAQSPASSDAKVLPLSENRPTPRPHEAA